MAVASHHNTWLRLQGQERHKSHMWTISPRLKPYRATYLSPRRPLIYHYTKPKQSTLHLTTTAYTTNHTPTRARNTPRLTPTPNFGGNEHPLPSLPSSNLTPNPLGTTPPPIPLSPSPPLPPSALRRPCRKPIHDTPTATIRTTAPTTAKASPNAAKSRTSRGKASDGRCG